MKAIFGLFAGLFLVSLPAFGQTVSDFSGKYRAIPREFPYIQHTIEVRADGMVTLLEELTENGKVYVASFGEDPDDMAPVVCQGKGDVSSRAVLEISFNCSAGKSFSYAIDFTGVDHTLPEFDAQVETTGNDASGVWLFARL